MSTKNIIKGKARDSKFEILRIIAMILIVFHHISMHGNLPMGSGSFISDTWFQFIGFGGRVGVWIFVMISGYFLIDQSFKLKKWVKIMGECLFYSLIIFFIVALFRLHPIGVKQFIRAILPFGAFNWFAYCYIVFYLLFPFLNILLKNLNQRQYVYLILVCTILWLILPTISGIFNSELNMFSSPLLLFFFFYAIGAYIRIYHPEKYISSKSLLIALAVCELLYLFFSASIFYLSHYIHIFSSNPFFLTKDSIFIGLLSLVIFLLFEKSNIKYHKYLNTFAKAMFGVYLIHDNELIFSFIWIKIFQAYKLYGSEYMIPKTFLIGFTVFFVCAAIDLLRIKFVEKPLFQYLNPKLDQYQIKLIDQFNKIYDKIALRGH